MTQDQELNLIIKEKETIDLDNFTLEIINYLGLLTSDVHYFKVKIIKEDENEQLGLLRIGSIEGSLKRELQLRKVIKNYRMVSPLLTEKIVNSVIINDVDSPQDNLINHDNLEAETTESQEEIEAAIEPENSERENPEIEADHNLIETIETEEELMTENSTEEEIERENNYLEEEYYPETDITSEISPEKLILLTEFPEDDLTLEHWLQQEHSPEENVAITTQICQFFNYLAQKNWCLINLIPQLVIISKPLQFYDLTNAYHTDTELTTGLTGPYIAPELASSQKVNELMGSYTIAVLLYQCFHQQLPKNDLLTGIEIKAIPRLSQLLKFNLSAVAEERFNLAQFLSLLVDTRKSLNSTEINWQIGCKSTIGLSPYRLYNEDNYGIRQCKYGNYHHIMMATVADGMGGMAKGEIASQIAVETVLKEPIPEHLIKDEDWDNWLTKLVEKANENVTKNVKNGGTTLSIILAINDKLLLAHVGDSRIYLLREGELKKLSEDHSYVAMLVASGQITQEESENHPDRNILTKSLGTKNHLSQGYVQNLTRTLDHLSLTLKNEDILFLCSDGVWDLISHQELIETFNNCEKIQGGVNDLIAKIIERGAGDNSTLLALKCEILAQENKIL